MKQELRKQYDSFRNFENKAFRSACYAPYVSLYFTTQGTVLACCKNGTFILGDVRRQSLMDIWKGDKIKELRAALKDYSFHLDCGFCEWEITGGNHKTATPLLFDEFPVQSVNPQWPAMIEFEGSNTCNFECIMCNGDASSSIRAHRDGLPALPRVYSDAFFEELRQFLPHLKRARFFGGEPFLTREDHRIWEMMIDQKLTTECHVTTNGSQFNPKVERFLKALPFFIVVSIDGRTKETIEKIRLNCRYEQLMENIQRFHNYTKERGTTFHLAFCLMRQNWHEFGDLLLFAEEMGIEVWVNTVIDPSFCSLYTLPPDELAHVIHKLEKQSASLTDCLNVNRKTWEEALLKLQSALRQSQGQKLSDILSHFYVHDDAAQRATNHAEKAEYAEAVAEAKSALEDDPTRYYALTISGYSHAMLNHLSAAEVDLNGALQLSNKRPEAFLNMARVKLKQHSLASALKNCLHAQQLAMPEDRVQFEASELLAFIYARQKRFIESIKALKPLASLQLKKSPILDLAYPSRGLRAQIRSEIDTRPEGARAKILNAGVRLLFFFLITSMKFSIAAKRMPRQVKRKLVDRGREFRARLFHTVQLTRLRLDRLISQLLHPHRFRVIATAAWQFPVYSQTFVYQELTQLIGKRFDVRFFYGELNPRKQLPAAFSRLWSRRRRHIFHYKVGERDYAYFLKRMPEKVNQLVNMICHASGVTAEDLRNHHNFLEGFTFARMVEAFHPDYLHSYFFYHGTLHTFFASYLLDIPRGVSCYADHMLKDYEFKMIPLHLNQCRVVIATSNRIKEELLMLAPGANSNQIIVKPNAIKAAHFTAMTHTPPRNGEPYSLIAVSRIEPKKGLIYFVEAVRQLLDQNINVKAHLVGGVDNTSLSKDYDRRLKERITELGLDSVIQLEGIKTHTEIKHLLESSHVFIAPFVETEYGDKDGIPTSLLEGMASGLPVVATDAGSIAEVVEDGREGLIVPQRDSQALANGISSLLNDPDRLIFLGKNAAHKIREKFDVDICEEIFHERLLNVLNLEKQITEQDHNKLLVSIITAFYNAGDFLQEAIESVLAQSYQNWELLLVDDGSTDAGTAIARRYAEQYPQKIHYIEHGDHQNRGAAPSRNVGFRHSKGQYVAILDADDVWLANKLERQVAILESQPRAAMVFGQSCYWTSWSNDSANQEPDTTPNLGVEPEKLYESPDLMTLLYPLGNGSAPCPSNILLRRSMMEKNGGFEENFLGMYQLYEDQVFLTKLYLKHPVYISSELWDKYRIQANSCMTRVHAAGEYQNVRKFFLEWLQKYLSDQNLKNTDISTALKRALDACRREQDPRSRKWSLRAEGANVASLVFPVDQPEVVRVEIDETSTKVAYDIQLNYPRLQVFADRCYELNFLARADSDRTIAIGFANAAQPWNNLGLYKKLNLNSEWQEFHEQFVASASEENARIHFDLGESDASVEISAVTLSFAALTEETSMAPGALTLAPDSYNKTVDQVVVLNEERRMIPVSLDWGWDRGLPIDRYYIEQFLASNSEDIRGYVLEISDDWYTKRFGGSNVQATEILDVNAENSKATIITDLTHADKIASNSFDCIVLPQTLQFIYDVPAAVRTLYRILKANGVLLATFPGATRTRMDDPAGSWYWSFTTASAQRLFGDIFSLENIRIGSYGNLVSAVSFLRGLASNELSQEELDHHDPNYEVIVTVRAVK